MGESVITSLRIEKEVLKEAKKKALELDMNLGDFIETSILHEIMKLRSEK